MVLGLKSDQGTETVVQVLLPGHFYAHFIIVRATIHEVPSIKASSVHVITLRHETAKSGESICYALFSIYSYILIGNKGVHSLV